MNEELFCVEVCNHIDRYRFRTCPSNRKLADELAVQMANTYRACFKKPIAAEGDTPAFKGTIEIRVLYNDKSVRKIVIREDKS